MPDSPRRTRSGDRTGGGFPLTALINPVITPLSEEMVDGIEGLPLRAGPGRHRAALQPYPLPRRLRPTAAAIEREARGFHARVVQHECDHLDGVLYPMRMRPTRPASASWKELRRYENKEAED